MYRSLSTWADSSIVSLEMQNVTKHAGEELAALDLNWWTCIPEEVIGPDPAWRGTFRGSHLVLC
jgi:hypothetical protein